MLVFRHFNARGQIIKTKTKKYHTVGTVPKCDRKIDTPNIHIHDRSLSWIGTGTSIKSGGAKLVL